MVSWAPTSSRTAARGSSTWPRAGAERGACSRALFLLSLFLLFVLSTTVGGVELSLFENDDDDDDDDDNDDYDNDEPFSLVLLLSSQWSKFLFRKSWILHRRSCMNSHDYM